MTTAVFAFYLFSVVLLTAAVMVIFSRNPVHSVLWLIVCFFNAGGLFILLGAEFLAMLLIIVYVGAVAVLFLFVVMMLDIDFATLAIGAGALSADGHAGRRRHPGRDPAGDRCLAARRPRARCSMCWRSPPDGMSNTQWIGSVLYTRYLYVFQAAGLVLLMSMIGAIVLTHRQRVGTKRQSIAHQVAMTPAKAVRAVKPGVGQGVDL